MRGRYLHADVETVERMEIVRELRLGEFDVLVGINLLREGLDLPEVSLVAIFDADKEGFLRSEGSPIRRSAAPHATCAAKRSYMPIGSRARCKGHRETDRRREKQVEFNLMHGIEPRSIIKSVQDIMEGARAYPRGKKGERRRRGCDETRPLRAVVAGANVRASGAVGNACTSTPVISSSSRPRIARRDQRPQAPKRRLPPRALEAS